MEPSTKAPLKLGDLDALVLAGGDSTRMGTRKGLLPLKGSTIIGSTMEVLGTLFRRVFVVARESSPWEGLGVEVLLDGRREQGSLGRARPGTGSHRRPLVLRCGMRYAISEGPGHTPHG